MMLSNKTGKQIYCKGYVESFQLYEYNINTVTTTTNSKTILNQKPERNLMQDANQPDSQKQHVITRD